MLSLPPVLGRAPWRHALLCLLLLGVLLHGPAQVLRQLLGAVHWHATPAVAAQAREPQAANGIASWLDAARAWRQQLQARSPLIAGHGGHGGQAHHHDGSERHHHGAGDATVIALEPAGDGDDRADGAASALLQPLALGGRPPWPGVAPANPPWSQAAATAWRDALARHPERPPRG